MCFHISRFLHFRHGQHTHTHSVNKRLSIWQCLYGFIHAKRSPLFCVCSCSYFSFLISFFSSLPPLNTIISIIIPQQLKVLVAAICNFAPKAFAMWVCQLVAGKRVKFCCLAYHFPSSCSVCVSFWINDWINNQKKKTFYI